MNASELATKMLEWEQKRKELDALESEITGAVLDLKQTQTVGNVKAVYSKGRREFDYEAPGKTADIEIIETFSKYTAVTDWEAVKTLIDPEIVEECTHQQKSTDWQKVCKSAKIEPEVVKEGTPSAKIKMI